MPDILGYWDGRAYDPDFNPNTEMIEQGYAKKERKRVKREEAKIKDQRSRLIKSLLPRVNLDLDELNSKGYEIGRHYVNKDTSSIKLKARNIEAIIGRVVVEEGETKVEVDYTGGKCMPDKWLREQWKKDLQLHDIKRIGRALDLKEFIESKGIPYTETPITLKEVIEALKIYSCEISGLLKKIH